MIDQNNGVVTIPGSFTSEDCSTACRNQHGVTVTGYEWHNSGRCAYHTKPISGGSGNNDYTCWTKRVNRRRTQILDHLSN